MTVRSETYRRTRRRDVSANENGKENDKPDARLQCHRERELVITDSVCENGIGSEAYWKEARQALEEQQDDQRTRE